MPSDTTAMRDELAKMMGWTLQHDEKTPCTYWWNRFTNEQCVMGRHPIPDTLGGAAACMPEGWIWERLELAHGLCWWAGTGEDDGITIPDTGEEKHDRFALALAARKAMKGTP
jgi:hypothetical protein